MTQYAEHVVDFEARLTALERQSRRWRFVALGAAALLLLGGATAFQRATPAAPLEGTSLILRDDSGRRAEIAVSSSGALEVRFGPGRGGERQGEPTAELVLIDPQGRRVARLGSMTAQHLAQ
jgi:hypothetical protein